MASLFLRVLEDACARSEDLTGDRCKTLRADLVGAVLVGEPKDLMSFERWQVHVTDVTLSPYQSHSPTRPRMLRVPELACGWLWLVLLRWWLV